MEVAEIVFATKIFLKEVLSKRAVRDAHESYLLLMFLHRLGQQESLQNRNRKNAIAPENKTQGDMFRNGEEWIKQRLCTCLTPFEKSLFARYCSEKKKRKILPSWVTYVVMATAATFIITSTAFSILFAARTKSKAIQLEWLGANVLGFLLAVLFNEPAFIVSHALALSLLTKRLSAKTVHLNGPLAAFVDALGRKWLKGERGLAYYVRDSWIKSRRLEELQNDDNKYNVWWANSVAVRASSSGNYIPFAKARREKSTVWTHTHVAKATRAYRVVKNEQGSGVTIVAGADPEFAFCKSRSLVSNVWTGRTDEL